RAGYACLDRIGVQARLAGVVHNFCPGVGGGYDLLIVINEVIHLPECLGVLLVGAPAGNGRRSGPGMKLLDGKVLEHDAYLAGIVRVQYPQRVLVGSSSMWLAFTRI